MKFYSTNRKCPPASFREAVLRGLAPDGGLYMPESVPALSASFLRSLPGRTFQEIALEVARALIASDVEAGTLERIVFDALNFDAPAVRLQEDLYSLELFHGPTLAFKDFGARFMARLLSHFNEGQAELTILVATSGDTGSAVAHGFHGVPGIRVVVLYPSGRVSEIQEKQMATLGGNITALEVTGNFDDCQRLVKQAFLDPDLASRLRLTSANSINIARLIPQSFYYFRVWAAVGGYDNQVVISVPSGNFGNLTAGLMAKRMGLPVRKFVAATNVNDVVPQYLRTGEFRPHPSFETISNAMDVGNPSNFARMLELYGGDVAGMRADVSGLAFTDEQTRAAMREVRSSFGYTLDPHGAVAYLGARGYRELNPEPAVTVFLETAHPAKFLDVVQSATSADVEIPERLQACLQKPKLSVPVSGRYEDLRAFLLQGAPHFDGKGRGHVDL